jgi:glycosyltransferase involved in cell wall biosynthesis
VWSALRRADADVYYVSCADMLVGQVVHFAARHDRRTVFRVAHDRDCTPEDLIIKYRRDRLIYEYGLRRVDTVLVQSEFQQSTLRRNYGLQGIVARMLVDRPQSIVALQDRYIDALWVNNFRDFKRPDRYLSLADSLPELRSHMIGGPTEYQRELFAQMSARAASIPTLTFHGQVPYHAVNDNYAHARVFVNTSDSEGFPNSYLQAWVRGTPVVAFFDPDGTIEREGLGFAVKDDDQMRAAVRRLAQDAGLWAAISKRCIEFMHRVYNDDDILAPYRAALCNSKPRPRG